MGVIVVVIRRLVARFEVALRGRGIFRCLRDAALEKHVHEQVHRLRLEHERARRFVEAAIEVLMDAVVVHDRRVAGFPLVANAVVFFGADAVEDVEDRLVDVAVFLRRAARCELFDVNVKRLAQAVLGLEVVFVPRLHAAVKLQILAFAHARKRAQPAQLLR